jgi:phosphoribosylformylglycinamidine synthase PurS subunit
MAGYEVFVTFKKGIFDPPGATAERALRNLGYEEVEGVSIGKYIRLAVDESGLPEGVDADDRVREMCEKLLANPVIEDFRIERSTDAAGGEAGAD